MCATPLQGHMSLFQLTFLRLQESPSSSSQPVSQAVLSLYPAKVILLPLTLLGPFTDTSGKLVFPSAFRLMEDHSSPAEFRDFMKWWGVYHAVTSPL